MYEMPGDAWQVVVGGSLTFTRRFTMADLLDFQLNEFKDEEQATKKAELEANKEALRLTLEPLVKRLRDANLAKSDAETAFSVAKSKVSEIEGEIRKVWGPFIEGVDKASIDIDGSRLESAVMLNVKTVDDEYIDWLKGNGYRDVMKWQIHHMTLKRIATELHNEGVLIPGLEYSKFNKIKLK